MAAVPVWVLLGGRTGDNNQLLRLASELGLPFRTLDLRYNALHILPTRLLGASLASLEPHARELIAPPWPQLVLGIGHRSVPVALAIGALSGGTSKLVRLGNPRLDPRRFDLIITTPQYRVPAAVNVLRLPLFWFWWSRRRRRAGGWESWSGRIACFCSAATPLCGSSAPAKCFPHCLCSWRSQGP